MLQLPSIWEQVRHPICCLTQAKFTRKKGHGIHGTSRFQQSLCFHVAVLGNATRRVDLVCAPEGLVAIETCSSGKLETGKGMGKRMYNILTLYRLIFNHHDSKWAWHSRGIEHLDTWNSQGIVFYLSKWKCCSPSRKIQQSVSAASTHFTTAVSVQWTFLLGTIEIDGKPYLHILRELQVTVFIFSLKTTSLKATSSWVSSNKRKYGNNCISY